MEPKASDVQALAVRMEQREQRVLAERVVTDRHAAASALEVFQVVAVVAVARLEAVAQAADRQVLQAAQVMIKEPEAVAPVVHHLPVA